MLSKSSSHGAPKYPVHRTDRKLLNRLTLLHPAIQNGLKVIPRDYESAKTDAYSKLRLNMELRLLTGATD